MSKGNRYDAAVIGAGVFGAWTAWHLARRGKRVLLADAYGPGNARASSAGESRIVRMGYGADELYTRWAVMSLAQWKEFFAAAGERLFHETGVLWLAGKDDSRVRHAAEVFARCGVAFEELSHSELEKRYPQIGLEGITKGLLELHSGVLMARRAVAVVAEAAQRLGVEYRVAQIGEPRFAPPALPTWLFQEDEIYGMPDLESRGLKIAVDRHGERVDPDMQSRLASAEGAEEARRFVEQRFPALRSAPIVETRVCQYENTWNGDFLIDRHPEMENVWFVGGGSGHGFKHGPAVGEYGAGRILGGGAEEARFSLASKETVERRAVF